MDTASDPLRTPVVVKSSELRFAFAFFGALLLAVADLFLLIAKGWHASWAVWVGIPFFGGGAVIIARQWSDARPLLVIDEDGICDRRLGVGLIPWSEITGASLKRGQRFISLELRNPERWLTRLSPTGRYLAALNRMMGFSVFNLNLAGGHASPREIREIYDLIVKIIATKRE